MAFGGMNYLAVLVAAVASFAFGSIYYMSLAKPWMAAVGKTQEEVKAGQNALTFIVTFVCQLIMAVLLAGVVGHLGVDMVTVRNGVITGFFLWLGFVMTTMVVNHAFQSQKKSLTLIDGGHWLGVLLVQGLVIGLFGA